MAQDQQNIKTTEVETSLKSSLSPVLASPDSISRAESFVSAPSTPLETQGSTPATTLSAGLEQEKAAEQWSLPKDGPLKTVIPVLQSGSTVKAVAPLSEEQQTKYDHVLADVSTWTTVPNSTAKHAQDVPMEEHERMWLTKECLLRYLRATKWNTAHALKRLQSTLSWRREYGADDFTADYISPENETGKQEILGYDNDGRPCWYMIPSRQNTKVSDRQIHQVSYMLDRAVDLMPPGQEKLAILISFKDAPRSSMPSVSIGRQALNVLQTHNPERLGRAVVIDMPWFMSTFFKLITPFIDPLTREKIRFDEPMSKFVPVNNLWTIYGGDMKFEYDHAVYWPSLAEEAKKRRAAYRERWETAGKMIGENEVYLRGGDCKPVREERPSAAVDTLSTETAKLEVS